jgi:asparagine synthase (glutamine-hydrolysing)
MCGIIGLTNFDDAQSMAKKGLESIRCRGTDHSKVTYYGKLALGHNLHSIIDFVAQPIESSKGVLVINCEIYNWKELAKKFKLKVKNDAELVLAMLDKKKFSEFPKIIEYFDGDYAFAYYSKIEEKIFLARDVIGVKPLVYSFDEKKKEFAFASEKKALNVSGLNAIHLNPRKIISFDLKNNRLSFIDRKISLKKTVSPRETENALVRAINKRIPDKTFGLLLSGGLDSTIIGKIIRKENPKAGFVGLFAGVFDPVAGFLEPKDYAYAKTAAKELGCELVIKKVFVPELESELPKIISLIESTDPIRVGVACTIYFATKEANALGLKVVFSGMGADELFAGYHRFRESKNINKDSYSYLIKLYENDLYFEDIITMANKLELRVPFLDTDLVKKSIYLNKKYKLLVNKKTKQVENKKILRDIALKLKLPAELALREKKAAQYGSNFDKAIEFLARKNKFKSKADYLKSISLSSSDNTKPLQKNVPIAALLSTGKDSIYALSMMEKQGYEVRCLIAINPKNKDSFMYHSPTIEIAKLQAKALGKRLLLIHTKGEKETELSELERGLMLAKRMFGIEGVSSGALFSNYQRERIENACEKHGLRHFAPLWHMNQENYLQNLVNSNFKAIITKIACYGMDESWVGREINSQAIRELVELNKKYGVNVAGEGGEYESLVLDAPIFKERIEVLFKKKMSNEFTGEIEVTSAKMIKKI